MCSESSKGANRLLRLLLEKYERSSAFGKEDWSRDVIVRLDGRTFPSEWRPDAAEARETLLSGALDLEQAGAARVRRHDGYARDLPAEVRLGPEELDTAYRLACAAGFLPLAAVLEETAAYVESLEQRCRVDWMKTYLANLAAAVRRRDTSALGLSAERLKLEKQEVRDSLAAASALAEGHGGMERIVSERLFRNSKRFAEIRSFVRDILVRADPRWKNEEPGPGRILLAEYGMRGKPVFLYCAGGIVYSVNGRQRHLIDDEPSAAIPEGIVPSLATGIAATGNLTITTIENETPYHLYVEEAGGPRGLASRNEFVLYTGGFPSEAARELLALSASCGSNLSFRHWGDPDAGGFHIWWAIRQTVGRPVRLFRTTSEWLLKTARNEHRNLPERDRAELASLLRNLQAPEAPLGPDIKQVVLVITTVLELGKWIEQERYLHDH